ncbi:TolC family protein [Flocculibacter collagenilyticus]|uniref:TolC family protein n=1 Tax=Flocculibacter collagenilyticus TaxID=2744479 RepID=UPI0018F2847F|nr:TolC family protein [Flocculibacter collagenilyticus]
MYQHFIFLTSQKFACFGFVLAFLVSVLAIFPVQASAPITLQQAIDLAIKNDPWLTANHQQQQATLAQRTAVAQLPDPKMSLSLNNLPMSSLSFDQEAMTQLKVGISQQFPRGDELNIKRSKLNAQAAQHPAQQANRRALLTNQLTTLWLQAFLAEQQIALIEDDKVLFQQLVETTQANYSSALGNTRQQDMIQAQLALTRLADRLVTYQQHAAMAASQIATLIGTNEYSAVNTAPFQLAKVWPTLSAQQQTWLNSGVTLTQHELYLQLQTHPTVQNSKQAITVAKHDIDLAEQAYQPQWGINASYGYRDDAPNGLMGDSSRDDFFSIGVSFDLPLFTNKKQDQQLNAAKLTTESVKTEQLLLIKQLMAATRAKAQQLNTLNQRDRLYQSQLLHQIKQQSDATLSAYTHDDGDFSEVIRARIAALNAAIDALTIKVERYQTVFDLQYYLNAEYTEY